MSKTRTQAPTGANQTYEPLTAKIATAMPVEAQQKVWSVLRAIKAETAVHGDTITLNVEKIRAQGVSPYDLKVIINRLKVTGLLTIEGVGAAYVGDDTNYEPEDGIIHFVPYEETLRVNNYTIFDYRLAIPDDFQKEFAHEPQPDKKQEKSSTNDPEERRVSFERKEGENRGFLHIPGYKPLPFDQLRCEIIDYLMKQSQSAWRTYNDMPIKDWKTGHGNQATKRAVRQSMADANSINGRISKHTDSKYPEAIEIVSQSEGKKLDNKFRWTLWKVD